MALGPVPGHHPQHPAAAARYAELHKWWTERPQLRTLYLHGNDDGCMTAKFTPWVRDALPAGSDVRVVENAGHFPATRTAGDRGPADRRLLGTD